MIVSIYTSRVVLMVLGVEDFGLYNVVAGVVAFFGFLNSAMSMATQRFLNVEMVNCNAQNLRKVFSMTLNIHFIIAVIVVILAETIGLYLVNNVLNITPERMNAANWVFQFVVIGIFFQILMVPYNSVILAREEMGVYAYVSILEVTLKLVIVFLLKLFSIDKLILYGLLMSCVTLIVFVIYKVFTYSKYPESHYLMVWNSSMFKEMSGFMGWNICGQLAQIFTTQGVTMVVNVFLGVVVNAAMAIQNQVQSAIVMFVQNFQTSFRPQITKSYAAEEINSFRKLVCSTSKLSFFMLYIISVPIIFNIDLILDIWLDTVPDYTATFCKLVIWFSYIEAMGMPLVMSIMATGKNRNYQIVVSIVIALNLLFVWLVLRKGFAPEWIFYIKICLAIFTLGVRLYFTKRQTSFPIKTFLSSAVVPCLIVLAVTQPLYYVFLHFYNVANLWSVVVYTTVLIFAVGVAIWYLGMNVSEKKVIISIINKKIKWK